MAKAMCMGGAHAGAAGERAIAGSMRAVVHAPAVVHLLPLTQAHGAGNVRTMRILLLLIVLLSAAGEEAGERTWAIPGTTLALSTPHDWVVVRDHAAAVLVLRSPPPPGMAGEAGERARGIIAVAVQPVQGEGPLAFAVRCRNDLERTATGLVLGKAENLVLGGRSWTRQPYTLQVGQFTFAQDLYATVIDDLGICITCSTIAEERARWQAAFAAASAGLGRSRLIMDLK
jgi:hypothetical protein